MSRKDPPPGFLFRPRHRRFAMPVSGDCMEPAISDGDYVVVSTRHKPQHGRFVVFEREHLVFVKEYRHESDGTAWLVALNGDRRFPVDESVHIVGCVTHIWRNHPAYYRWCAEQEHEEQAP